MDDPEQVIFYYCAHVHDVPEGEPDQFLYLFSCGAQPNEQYARVKFGKTLQDIKTRLGQYNRTPITCPTSIYYTKSNCIEKREDIIKYILNACNNVFPIKKRERGFEFFKGDFSLIQKVYMYVSSMSIVDINTFNINQIISIKSFIDSIRYKNYQIEYITPYKPYIMIQNDIMDHSDTEIDEKENNNINQSINTFICSKCNRQCKDKKGLAIHMARCKDPEVFSCQYCQIVLSTKKCLQNHYDVCVERKINDIKKEYKDKLHKELEILQNENIEYKRKNQELEKEIQTVKIELSNTIKQKDKRYSDLLDLQTKEREEFEKTRRMLREDYVDLVNSIFN